MKISLLTAVAMLSATSVAYADGLPANNTPVASPAAASSTYDWSGYFVGINGGYGMSHSEIGNVKFGSGQLYSYPDEDGSFNMTGGLVGGQIGYTHQVGNIVLGLEADLDYAGMKGTYAFPPPNPVDLDGKLESLGTLRARFGYAFDNVLIFATGGLAYAETHASLASVVGPVITASGSKSYVGYAAGGGVEYGLTSNWSVKAEYLYMDLGEKTNSFTFTGNAAQAAADISLTAEVGRVGVNYRF